MNVDLQLASFKVTKSVSVKRREEEGLHSSHITIFNIYS